MKKLIILIVFLICTIDVIGQKEIIVSGIVKDEHNKVLPYIDVLLKNNDSLKSIVAYAITDNLGRYQIIKNHLKF